MTETSTASVDSKPTTDVFGAIGASIAKSQEMQATENRERLKESVRDSTKKALEYFSARESSQQKLEELGFNRHQGVNALRIGPATLELEEIESKVPTALVIPESEGSAGVFAKLKKDPNEDFVRVGLTPFIDGQVIEQDTKEFGISEHEIDVVYEFDPVTDEVTRHGINDFDVGDQTYSQVAQALIMCVNNLEETPK